MTRAAIFILIATVVTIAATTGQNLFAQSQQGTVQDINDLVPWNREVPPQTKRAKVYLGQGYVFGGVELPAGKYLVVHAKYSDDEGIFIYRMPFHETDAPVAKQRCTAFEGPRVDKFSIQSTNQPDGTYLISSIQFPGSTEIHFTERAEIWFGHSYMLGGVELRSGRYLVVHRDDLKKRKAECLYVFRIPYHSGDEPVAKADCKSKQGQPVPEFTIRSTSQPNGTLVIRSIQFAGGTEVHTFAPGS